MDYYNSLNHYAKKKGIDWRTAERHVWKYIFQLEIKWKKCYVETLQMLEFIVKCHIKSHLDKENKKNKKKV